MRNSKDIKFNGLFAYTSQNRASVGEEITITAIVRNQDGEIVENANVTFSGGSQNWTDTDITIQMVLLKHHIL